MSLFSKSLAIAFLGLLTLAPGALAQRRVSVGGYYGGYYVFAGSGWYAPYGPYYYYPYYPAWGWGWGSHYGYAPDSGKVKIITHNKDASVYVDGGYAGLAGKLKKFPLRSGTHDIELRGRDGKAFHQQRVDVIPGKTVEVDADLRGH